jgi:lipopolysaccharide exporter
MSSYKSYWVTSGFFSVLQRFSTLLFNFGSSFMLFRIFSLKEFGVWGLFLMVVSVVEVARSGLIQNAIVKYLSISPKEEHPKIISASFSLNVILSTFTILLIVFGSHTFSVDVVKAPEIEILLYYYIITTLILIPFFQFQYIQQANLLFKGVFWGMFSRQGLFFLGILICFVSGYKPSFLNLVHLQTLAAFIGAIVGFIYARKLSSFSRKLDFEWIRKLFGFGKFGFITNLSSMVSGSIDQSMLSNMISTEAVALQRAALQVTNAVEVPTKAMADIVFPQSARRMHSDGKGAVKYLYEKSVGVIFAIIFPFSLVVLLLPGLILSIVTGGGEYLQSIAILQVTVIYTLIIPFDRQAGTIFDSTGRQKLNFFLQMIAMVLNFIFNLYFIRHYGIIGAAYGSLTTYACSFFVKQLILRKSYGIDLIQILKYSWSFYGEAYKIFRQRIGSN